jgi:hypothetical protein
LLLVKGGSLLNMLKIRNWGWRFLLQATGLALYSLILGCGPPPEPLKNILERVGDVDLSFKNQSLESLNNVLQLQGKQLKSPEVNTELFQWFEGAIKAKFITNYDSNSKYKLIELEMRKVEIQDWNFRGSILGVHITDSADKIPGILSKAGCSSIEQNESGGTAKCKDNWNAMWSLTKGSLDSFKVYESGYIKIPMSK